MLEIKEKNIIITRGDVLPITITSINKVDGSDYEFKQGDIIRFKIFDSKNVNNVYLQKDFTVEETTTAMLITMTANEMKIGEISGKEKNYWYEIELNPDTDDTQTLVGYEKGKPAIITILPEGGEE